MYRTRLAPFVAGVAFLLPTSFWDDGLRGQPPQAPSTDSSAEPYAERTWTDAAGKFTLQATLVEFQQEWVRLRKADDSIIDVPLAKLSSADRDYVTSIEQSQASNGAQAGNPFDAPSGVALEANTTEFTLQSVEPSSDRSELAVIGPVIALPKSTPCEALEVDRANAQPIVGPGQCVIAETDPYDVPSAIVTLQARQGLVALTIARAKAGMDEPHRGRLLIGAVPRGPFQLVLDRQEAIQILDHNEATGQTLLMCGLDGFKRGGDIVVMEGLLSNEPIELYRRQLPGHDKPGFQPQVSQARLIAADVAVVVVDSKLYCWNLRSSELLYCTEDRAATAPVAFSPHARWMAISQAGGFNLVDPLTGQDHGYVDTQTGGAPGVLFHPDGRRLAYCESNTWGVWDCQEARMVFSAVVTEHLGNRPTGWVDNHLLLTDSGNLLDSQSQMLVWFYYTGPTAGQRLWHDSLSVVTTPQNLKLDTLPMPDPRAKLALRKLDTAKNLMVTSPGTEVRIDIESSEKVDEEVLTGALTEAIERAGWKVNPQAKLTVVAKIGRGKPYTLQYTLRSIGSGGGRGAGEKTSVDITPFTAQLEIRSGRNVLWTRQTQNHVPSMLFLRGDETVEQAVKKFERPQPEFFSSLLIPPRIPKAEVARGLGASRLNKGVWVDFPRP